MSIHGVVCYGGVCVMVVDVCYGGGCVCYGGGCVCYGGVCVMVVDVCVMVVDVCVMVVCVCYGGVCVCTAEWIITVGNFCCHGRSLMIGNFGRHLLYMTTPTNLPSALYNVQQSVRTKAFSSYSIYIALSCIYLGVQLRALYRRVKILLVATRMDASLVM